MLLVCLTGSFAKVALICLMAWFATSVENNLLLLDFAVCPLQKIVEFEWFLILLIFSFESISVERHRRFNKVSLRRI